MRSCAHAGWVVLCSIHQSMQAWQHSLDGVLICWHTPLKVPLLSCLCQVVTTIGLDSCWGNEGTMQRALRRPKWSQGAGQRLPASLIQVGLGRNQHFRKASTTGALRLQLYSCVQLFATEPRTLVLEPWQCSSSHRIHHCQHAWPMPNPLPYLPTVLAHSR